MEKGKVKTLVGDRGFGFIVPDDGSGDLFFHVTGMADGAVFDALAEDQGVEYEREHGPKGQRATQVKPVE